MEENTNDKKEEHVKGTPFVEIKFTHYELAVIKDALVIGHSHYLNALKESLENSHNFTLVKEWEKSEKCKARADAMSTLLEAIAQQMART